MTTIKYQPTSLQSFGAPGTLFSGAAESLRRATGGLKDTLQAYESGVQREQDRRSRLAFADIEAAQTQDAYNNLVSRLGNKEAITSKYGVKDPTAILAALREQEFDVRDREAKDFAYQQAVEGRADADRLDAFRLQLAQASSPAEVEALYKSEELSKFHDPSKALGIIDRRVDRESKQAFNELARTKNKLEISKLQSSIASGELSAQNATLMNQVFVQNPHLNREEMGRKFAEFNVKPSEAAEFLDIMYKESPEEIEARKQIKTILKDFDSKDDLGILNFIFQTKSSKQEAAVAAAHMRKMGLKNIDILSILERSTDDDDFEKLTYEGILNKFITEETLDPRIKENYKRYSDTIDKAKAISNGTAGPIGRGQRKTAETQKNINRLQQFTQ